jgi:hypothetical protein
MTEAETDWVAVNDQIRADKLADRVEQLTADQRRDLLWRLVFKHTSAVETAFKDLEGRDWRL